MNDENRNALAVNLKSAEFLFAFLTIALGFAGLPGIAGFSAASSETTALASQLCDRRRRRQVKRLSALVEQLHRRVENLEDNAQNSEEELDLFLEIVRKFIEGTSEQRRNPPS